ncbi:MAG: thiamine pyrophosphate-requiring protein [Chloroflexi bacterium]|nr:thiamine pyrophosphate-requiring protein [Chloroflexota bacterium]
MPVTVGEFIVQRLHEWGVRRIFGYPGDGINGLLGAMQKHTELLEFVQVRHEEMSAFMACGHAKFTGEVGICLATSGPGAIHLLNGLYDARMDHQPVVAIVGQSARFSMGGDYQQEVDLLSLFKDMARDYVQMVVEPAQARTVIDRALRIAQSERTVTCVILPKDIQEEEMQPMPREHGSVFTGHGALSSCAVPLEEDIRRAADILNAGQRVAMLVGAGALGATDEMIEVAERLGAGVAKALLGKAALPDDLPFVTGSIGVIGTRPSWDLMMNCDTLLMIGTSFPYSEFLPPEGQARGVQIDIDGRMVSLRYPTEINLIGDSAQTLRALLRYLNHKTGRAWREEIEAGVADWWKVLEERAHNEADPLNPQRVFWELSPRLPDNCILTTDSGSAATWFARDLRIRRGMMASVSGNLASMGSALPYAVAAKFAYPDRAVIAMAGDGAMQMNGNNVLMTVAKYWRQWSDPRLIVLVLNNGDLNFVTWEQRQAEMPQNQETQPLPDFSYARYAESLGLMGIELKSPDAVGSAWDQALRANRPVVIDAHTDPNVPAALPPQLPAEHLQAYYAALRKGDPEAVGVSRQLYQEIADAVATASL